MRKILLIGTVIMLLAGQAFSEDTVVSELNTTVSELNTSEVKYQEMTAEEAENILKNKQKNSKKIGSMTSVNGGGVAGAAIGAALLGATFIYNKIVDSIEGDK